MEPTLCWIQAQRENGKTLVELSELMMDIVEASETHSAKEILAEFVRERREDLLAQKRFKDAIKGRMGHHKTESEVDNICNMLEWLDELGQLPLIVMTCDSINRMPKRALSNEEDKEMGARLTRMDKKVETYHCEVKREIYSIKPSYAALAKELNAGVQSGLVPAVARPHDGVVHGVQGNHEPMEQDQPQTGAGGQQVRQQGGGLQQQQSQQQQQQRGGQQQQF